MSLCKTTSSSSSSSTAKAWIVHGLLAGAAIVVAVGARAYHLSRSGRFRSRVVGIIPARFASSRFQGKPLVQILGKPMIQVATFASALRFFSIVHLFFNRVGYACKAQIFHFQIEALSRAPMTLQSHSVFLDGSPLYPLLNRPLC